jgi:hypothetical protein
MKQRLVEIIKKVLTEQPKKKKCDCGCDECMGAPMLNESKQYVMPISENMRYHLDKKIPIHDNTFRPGSKAHIDLIHETRLLWKKGVIELQGEDKKLFENTDLGRFGIYEGEVVPLDYPMMEILTESEFNEKKVWAFINSKPFYNKSYKPMFSTAQEIWDGWVREKEKAIKNNDKSTQALDLYDNFEWEGSYKGDDEEKVLQRRQTYNTLRDKNLTKAQMLDGYEVDFFHTKANVYANIEIPSENPTFEDDIQIKGTGKTEEEAFEDLQQNYKNYKKTGINEAEKKKQPALGKPKRGGSKKFYVYVKDPKTKRIKKVSFGMAGGGLRAKLNNSKARAAFSKRHNCPQKKDRTKASYWSCRLPRYAKLLGFKTTFSGYW